MIKFILGLIAVTFVSLAIYTYMDKNSEQTTHKTAEVKKAVVSKEHKKSKVDEYNISHPKYIVDEKKILQKINGEAKIQLDDETIRKIELELNGKVKTQLDDEAIRKIESELNGKVKKQLDDETIRKIESELNGEAKIQLDDETIRKIESELNGETKIQLDDETIRKIESELKNNGFLNKTQVINKKETK